MIRSTPRSKRTAPLRPNTTRCRSVRRVQHPGAVLALGAARRLITAGRAGPDHIAVGQESLVGVGIDLLGHPLLDEAGLPELLGEPLGEPDRKSTRLNSSH